MMSLEHPLKGESQEISNRITPLAYSAWHIYPDFIIFGEETKNVKFNDDCVSGPGVGTLVSQPRSRSNDHGTTWSLALSHLRYYGDPVIARTDLDTSRVIIQQLNLIALGSIFTHWAVPRKDFEYVSQ